MERLKNNIVPPDGPIDSQVCFIGQAPGREENTEGRPFVGQAGGLLNRCLGYGSMVRSQVLVNNVFAQRPPNNDVKYYFESYLNKLTWEGQEHLERLKSWLEGLLDRRERNLGGPNLLVALGAEALWALTGHKRITKWRGSVLPCTLVPGFKVYGMFHPSYINRLMNEPEERLQGMKKTQKMNALPLFLMDMERVKYQSSFKEHLIPKREFVIDPGMEELIGFFDNLKDEELISVDIETIRTDKGPIVWCIGFAPKPGWGFTVPIIKKGQVCWSGGEEAEIWRRVSKVFLNRNSLKIFQNGGYDLSILGRYYGLRVANGTYADTMWCHQVTFPYLEKALHILTSIYTWEPYYKDEGKWWDGRRISDEAEFAYNTKDCCVTREIWPIVERKCKEHGMWGNYQNSIKVIPSLLWMMVKGVKLDVEAKGILGEEFKVKAEEASGIVENLSETKVNLSSPSQLQRLLYGYLALPIQYNHKTKKPTTDKDAINRLRKKVSGESNKGKILKALSDHRQYSKLGSTYTNMEVENDGRVRTSYGFVSTFRLSSSESHFGGGGNLQNIPVRTDEGKMIRKLFIPDSGFVLVASDLEQAEARVISWDAEDLVTIELFQSGGDVHWNGAKKIFDLPSDLSYEKKELYKPKILDEEMSLYMLRRLGKTVEYADSYGMGPVMLQNILIREEVYLELKTCKALLAARRRAKPLVVEWQRGIRERIRTTRTLINFFGDKREFHGRLNDNLFRSAYAYIPQSTVGRILEFAIQGILENIPWFEPLLNVHDEVVGQCRTGDVGRTLVSLKKELEIPLEIHNRTLTIPCSFKVGENWGEMEEEKL